MSCNPQAMVMQNIDARLVVVDYTLDISPFHYHDLNAVLYENM